MIIFVGNVFCGNILFLGTDVRMRACTSCPPLLITSKLTNHKLVSQQVVPSNWTIHWRNISWSVNHILEICTLVNTPKSILKTTKNFCPNSKKGIQAIWLSSENCQVRKLTRTRTWFDYSRVGLLSNRLVIYLDKSQRNQLAIYIVKYQTG